MTVQELIKKLETLDPTLEVVLSGYEGGCSYLEHLTETTIALNVNKEWWYGPHEVVHEGDDWMHERTETHKKTKAIYLS